MLVDISVMDAEDDKIFVFNGSDNSEKYLVRRVKLKEGTKDVYLQSDNGPRPEFLQGSFAERAVAKVLWSFCPHG